MSKEILGSLELNRIYQMDCMEGMKLIPNDSISFTLTDIPYEKVNKKSNGLREIDKNIANTKTFELNKFLNEVYRVTKGTILIFCGHEQYSEIYDFFNNKKGTTRGVCWHKSNPSPMNGEYIYLNSFELAVWFKKPKATFNCFCKHNIFNTSVGGSKIHPTQKNIKLFEELILDNSNVNEIVLDTCMGSGTTAVAATLNNRKWIGFETEPKYIELANKRLEQIQLEDDLKCYE